MLKLKDIRIELPFNVNHGSALHNIKSIAEGRYDITVDYDVWLPTKKMNLQRPFVWTLLQKQQLILSILKDIKIPTLTIIDYSIEDEKKSHIYKVIDGKQRLSTIISFYKNEFQIEHNGKLYYFSELDEWGQRAISLLRLTANIGYEYPDALISDDDKIAWFELINFAGTQQDIEHLNKLKS